MALFGSSLCIFNPVPLVDEQDPHKAMPKGRLPSADKEQTGKPGGAPQKSF